MKPVQASAIAVALLSRAALAQPSRPVRALASSAPVAAPSKPKKPAPAPVPAPAPAPTPAPATPRAFATAYAFAVRSGDSIAVQRLVHPLALACLSGPNGEFLGALVSKDLRRRDQVLGDYKYSIDTVDHYTAPVSDSLFRYAVMPTQRVRLEFEDDNGSGVTVTRDLAPSGDGWLMTAPCPTKAGLSAFRAQRSAYAAETAKSRKVIAALPDSLRLTLIGLLQQGKTNRAISRYRAVTGEDSTSATRVITALNGMLR